MKPKANNPRTTQGFLPLDGDAEQVLDVRLSEFLPTIERAERERRATRWWEYRPRGIVRVALGPPGSRRAYHNASK
jgi:hypothetical protein